MNKLKGLSLSFCIQDILAGRVNLDDVAYIETGTKLETEEEWATMFELYNDVYWRKFPVQAIALVDKMRKQNMIMQPRLNGACVRFVGDGCWVFIDEHGREVSEQFRT